MSQNILVAYFSGTGGTKRIAQQFDRHLKGLGNAVTLHSLDMRYKALNRKETHEHFNEYNMLILLYVVHEMDAPKPVFEWINDLPPGNGKPIAVISVSGGGDMWPNRSCRVNSITMLEEKGYNVFYERMMVMPSNIGIYTKSHAAMWLLKIIPKKVEKYSNEILLMKRLRGRKRKKYQLFSTNFKWYNDYLQKVGKRFYITEECVKCKWCIENCSMENITEVDGKIVFGHNCIMCFRCLYGCPNHAIRNKSYLGLLKNGYSLEGLERKMKDVQLDPIEKCCTGILWLGVRKYLLENIRNLL